jgi:hypothetical protein
MLLKLRTAAQRRRAPLLFVETAPAVLARLSHRNTLSIHIDSMLALLKLELWLPLAFHVRNQHTWLWTTLL